MDTNNSSDTIVKKKVVKKVVKKIVKKVKTKKDNDKTNTSNNTNNEGDINIVEEFTSEQLPINDDVCFSNNDCINNTNGTNEMNADADADVPDAVDADDDEENKSYTTDELVEMYMSSMNDKKRKGFFIAQDHLGSSFDIYKSIGFLQFCKNFK